MTALGARIRDANRALVQWRTDVKIVHRKDSYRSRRISDGTSHTKSQLAQVSKALAELYELIEKYGPTFYTKRYHNHAARALRLVGKLPSCNDQILYL
jgi:hypothetical protein